MPDEVFLIGDSNDEATDNYRLIDWQRPVLGPRGLDLVELLRTRGIDPQPHLDAELVRIDAFLLLHWAAHELLPSLPSTP